jgi:hypothetical protein
MRRDFIYDRPCLSHSAFPRPWSVSLTASVKRSKGVDVCFDNTGGPIHDAVMRNLSIGAQVIICGRIALAAQFSKPDIGERFMGQLIMSRASIHGFLVFDWWHRRDELLILHLPRGCLPKRLLKSLRGGRFLRRCGYGRLRRRSAGAFI